MNAYQSEIELRVDDAAAHRMFVVEVELRSFLERWRMMICSPCEKIRIVLRIELG